MSVKMKEAVSFQESRAVKPLVPYYVTTREDAFTLMENTPQPCAQGSCVLGADSNIISLFDPDATDVCVCVFV